MDNNKAFVCRLKNITPIEGADKIVQAQVFLNGIPITQVVVGVDTKEDTPVVYFDSNLCLSDRLIADYPDLAVYLAKSNRVRCIKLRGVISNGLCVDLTKFAKYTAVEMPEGYAFDSIGDVEICHKYVPVKMEPTARHGSKERKAKKPSRIIPEMFRFHVDTEQLPRNVHKLHLNDVISISRKVHGTSAIVSHTQVRKFPTVREKIAKAIGIHIEDREWDYLYSSRSVIKNDALTPGFYKYDLWTETGKKYFGGKLHKGETVYYEIVGYLPGTKTFIQKNYDYGTLPGDCSIAVYRITSTNPDGVVLEYSWAAMRERCKEMGVPIVQEYYYGRVTDFLHAFDIASTPEWASNLLAVLKRVYLEQDCPDNLCKKMPDEGIVLRVEAKDIQVYKYKSEKFLTHESKAKEDEVIDIEEQEGAI